LGTDSK